MRSARSALLGLALLLFASSAPLAAQLVARTAARDPGPWSMEGRVGLVWPVGVLSDLERMAGGVGVGVDYRVLSRLSIRADAGTDFLLGRQAPYPDLLTVDVPSMTLWNLRVGPVVWLTPPDRSVLEVSLGLLGGATIMDTDDSGVFATPDGNRDFTHTYPGLDGVAWLGVRVNPQVVLFLSGRARGVFTSKADTGVFSRLSTRVDAAGFSSVWVVPLQAGVRVLF